MRKLFYLILVTISIFSLSCSDKKESEKGKIVLRLASHPDLPLPGEKEGFMHRIIKNFESQNPDIKVKFEEITGDIHQKILTEMAGGISPDVFMCYPQWISTFADKGVILDIEPLLQEGKIKLIDYYPQAYESYSHKKKIYAISESMSPFVLYYNKKLFDEMKVAYPDDKWTWQTLLVAAKKLTKIDNRSVTTQFGLYTQNKLEIFIRQNKGRIFSEDGIECIIDDAKNVDAVNFMCDLVTKYCVVPNPNIEEKVIGGQEMFMMQKVAMFYGGKWYSDFFRTNRELKYGIALLPKGKVNATEIVSHAFAISSYTKHRKEAFELIRYLAGEETQRFMHFTVGDSIPSLRKLATSKEFLNKFPQEGIDVYIESMKYGFVPEVSPFIAPFQMQEIIKQEIEKVFLGEQSVKDGLNKIKIKANQIIEKDRKKL